MSLNIAQLLSEPLLADCCLKLPLQSLLLLDCQTQQLQAVFPSDCEQPRKFSPSYLVLIWLW